MAFHRTHAEEKLVGDFCVRVAKRDQAHDLDLSVAQGLAAAALGPVLVGKMLVERGLQVGHALGRPAHREDKLGVGGFLEDVAGHASPQRLPGESRFVAHRENHNFRFR